METNIKPLCLGWFNPLFIQPKFLIWNRLYLITINQYFEEVSCVTLRIKVKSLNPNFLLVNPATWGIFVSVDAGKHMLYFLALSTKPKVLKNLQYKKCAEFLGLSSNIFFLENYDEAFEATFLGRFD